MQKDPVRAISESRYFSVDWYLRTYPDVAHSGMDPVQHYLHIGAPLQRDPGPDFSASYYLRHHADVREAGHNPLWHYELFGRDEGRDIAPSQLYRDTRDPALIASEIDRERPLLNRSEARRVLETIFSQRLDGYPSRIMENFEPDRCRITVECLSALEPEEKRARKRLASVIMPTCNRADRIQSAISSVLEQSHHALELIVVDDGSTDATCHVLANIDDSRLKILYRGHEGVSRARNAGLVEARGEVIFYLDSDNVWTRDFIRLMLIALEFFQAQCAYSALSIVDEKGQVQGYRGEPFDREACLLDNYVDLNIFCHTRALYERLGGFDPLLQRMVDWDLILRYTHSLEPLFCPFIGCHYTDNKVDSVRISNSKPYFFKKIVQHKNAKQTLTAVEALDGISLNVAIRVGDSDSETPHALAAEFEASGHHVRIDPPNRWAKRHPYQDDLVLLFPSAVNSPREPEQITLLCLSEGKLSPADQFRNILDSIRKELFQSQ